LSGDKRAGQVSLQISESPSAGDLVGVASSVAELRIVLLTPGGKRVTEQNAADSGFIWLRRQDSPLRLHKVICSWGHAQKKDGKSVQHCGHKHREGVYHGPKGQSELRSLGQAEAYPTKSAAFLMWGEL
jgi:hypothetical protein